MKSARALNRRNVHERQAIACLRGEAARELRDGVDGRHVFARLVEMAGLRGLIVFPACARFISDGEIELLANLAAAQRQAGRALVDVDDREFEALLACATLLREAGVWLPMAGLRIIAPDRRQVENVRSRTGMARLRALSLVQSRESASTDEFIQIGVSRQYVSRLCKDGLIQRVRHGWYRAAPLVPRQASGTHLHA